jgi:hypothetical protein
VGHLCFLKVVLFLAILRDFVPWDPTDPQRILTEKSQKQHNFIKKMNPDGLYEEPFVVAVWAMAEGQRGADGSQATSSRHRVHVKRIGKKWQIMIRNKPYEEQDAVSEGLGPYPYSSFKHYWVSQVEVQLFSGKAPSVHTNWDEILAAAKSCINDNATKISIIRQLRTKQRKREEKAAAARAKPPIPLYEFHGVTETMAQTRERQAANEPLRNGLGRSEQEERDIYIEWVMKIA